MTAQELFRIRIALVQAFLHRNNYDGVLLNRADNFAMATGGKRNFINTFTENGANALFVDRDGNASFVGNNIEYPRIMTEELAGLGCGSESFLWFEGSTAAIAKDRFKGNLVSDDGSLGENVHAKLASIRALLSEAELEKYRRLGAIASEAMTNTVEAIEQGMSESDITAFLMAEGQWRGCHVPVALVAADDRIARYRHPLPTVAPLLDDASPQQHVQRYVMVVGCFQREGLVVSVTRFRKVDELPEGVEADFARIVAVDAAIQNATAPGRSLGEVFSACQEAYRTHGFAENEWHNHHQGGATGYGSRTRKGTPGETFPVLDESWNEDVSRLVGQDLQFGAAFAWNPSAPGVKSEDTFILRPDGIREIVSETPAFPQIDLDPALTDGGACRKSGIAS